MTGYPFALADVDRLVDAPTDPTPAELAAYRAAPPVRNAVPFGQVLDADLFAASTPARLCGTLTVFRDAANAHNPGRDRASDGWIGDAAHAARDSQHNPDVYGVVTALDLDVDGLPLAAWFERIRAATAAGTLPGLHGGHLILNRRITTPDFRGWYAYRGANPHVLHGHAASSRDRARYDDRSPFAPVLSPPIPTPAPPAAPAARTAPPWPLPRGHYFGDIAGPARSHGGFYASERPHVTAIQQALHRWGFAPGGRWADGKFERPTVLAVAAWQRAHMPGTTLPGQVWADDWRKLLSR